MFALPELQHRPILRYVASSAALLCVTSSVVCAAQDANPSRAAAPESSRASTLGGEISRALAYEHGEGVPKDAKIAAALYCEAAVAGSAEAAFRLGWMYANGRGVAHDDDVASALFGLAAESGHTYARLMLDRLGGVHGMLPDCMMPPAPPPSQSTIAADEGPIADRLAELLQGRDDVVHLVDDLAPQFGIDPRLALAVIAVESNFNPVARSARDAQGLMQLIPETAARFNVRHPFDPKQNVRGGLAYLRWLLAYYRGQVALVAAAYNAGEGVVDRYRGIPPYPETRDYVRRILALFRRAFHPFDASIVEPSVVARFSDHR